MKRHDGWQRVLLVQGLYYLLTGLWGLLHLRSFMRVTGPKVDTWLVRTVSALVAAMGLGFVMHSGRPRMSSEMQVIAGGSAVGLAAIDLYYVSKHRISWVYLLDAMAQLGLLAGLLKELRPVDFGRYDVAEWGLLVEGEEPGVAASDVHAAD